MLETLHVKNLAIIDEAEVEFEAGLNILTGETGAGKSVIIGSINLALGEKATKGIVRANADYGLVELIFQIQHKAQRERLEALDIFPEDDRVILSRKIMDNRSVCKVNSETVSVGVLKSIADILIDIHGQHEHQSLLHKKNHLQLLDDYAKEKLGVIKSEYQQEYEIYLRLKSDFEENDMDPSQLEREISFLQFEIDEIEDAALQPGEDEQLEVDYKKQSHMQKITEVLSAAYAMTGQEQAGAEISRAFRELSIVESYDEAVGGLKEQLGEIDNLLNDFNRELSQYMSDNVFDEEEFKTTEQRLNDINHLKSKYGNTIEEILQDQQEKQEKLEKLLDYTRYKEQLKKEISNKEQELEKLSDQITAIRKAEADVLQERMKQSLLELNFTQVQFEISFEKLKGFQKNGVDSVEFLISTNAGEALKPLEKVASGGELSRIMLALKSVCAENDHIETLIFDEIDTGISGRTAQMVSEKMNTIAKSHQVICITHLPQIAAMADTHFLIEKSVHEDKTISSIEKLDRTQSVEELSRMLGGVQITDSVRASAKEMKELAEQAKQS